jgi:SHS2 domain-containing protein
MKRQAKFKFLPHTTDAEFESYGRTLAQSFENAARATFSSMTDLAKVKPKKTVRFSVKRRGDDVSLLYDFLDRLIYLYDWKQMFFASFKVKLTKTGLSAAAKGEKISQKHPKFSLVKSVTYHEMAISRRGGKTTCRVVLDI